MSTKLLKGMGEWLTAIGIVGTLLPSFLLPLATGQHAATLKPLIDMIGQIGLAVFFAGVLLSIKDIKNKAQATEEAISLVQRTFDSALKYGPAVKSVVGVVNRTASGTPQDTGAVHIRAGGKILLYHVDNELPSLAESLVDILNGRGEMKLAEPYFVSRFLNSLEKLLPDRCVWCGVTRLTRGWVEKNGEPGFSEFRDGLRDRAAKKSLSVFRIYAVGADSSVAGFRQHIDREVASGVSARILDIRDFVPDISLIWQPLESESCKLVEGSENPITVLSSMEALPLCGLKFETRFASMFQSVSIVPGGTPEFQRLMNHYSDLWNLARSAGPPQSGSAPQPPPNGIDRRFTDFRAA
jgi:hypothetical protein